MLVTMLVMGVVATAVMTVAMQTFTDTATITNRRDVISDARTALDRLSKQLRQGEVVHPGSSVSQITFNTYVDGASATVVWRATGTSAPFALQESRDDGANFATVASSLASKSLFTYVQHAGVTDEVTITLPLETRTSTYSLTTDVHLRNALT
jgi:type II secretory pathway pseudopilin PulG